MSAENTNNACAVCSRQLCNRCGRTVQNDRPRVGMSFTPAELAGLIITTIDPALQARMLCALGSLDAALEARTRMELASADPSCTTCKELRHEVEHLENELREAALDIEDRQRQLEDARYQLPWNE